MSLEDVGAGGRHAGIIGLSPVSSGTGKWSPSSAAKKSFRIWEEGLESVVPVPRAVRGCYGNQAILVTESSIVPVKGACDGQPVPVTENTLHCTPAGANCSMKPHKHRMFEVGQPAASFLIVASTDTADRLQAADLVRPLSQAERGEVIRRSRAARPGPSGFKLAFLPLFPDALWLWKGHSGSSTVIRSLARLIRTAAEPRTPEAPKSNLSTAKTSKSQRCAQQEKDAAWPRPVSSTRMEGSQLSLFGHSHSSKSGEVLGFRRSDTVIRHIKLAIPEHCSSTLLPSASHQCTCSSSHVGPVPLQYCHLDSPPASSTT